MSTLTIQERQSRGVTIIDLAGKVTIGGSNKHLHDAIKRLVHEGKNQIILNLAKVTYIDSSGLGELVSGYSTLKANNGFLKLLNVPGKVIDLMVITKLYTVFEIYESEEESVNSFETRSENVTEPLNEHFASDAVAGSSGV